MRAAPARPAGRGRAGGRTATLPASPPPAIAAPLLRWWHEHGRKDLPWQHDPTPWRVWVSEIMLQQTQVKTVVRYYDRFLAAFPTPVALADASPDRVLHLWSGLGYYARARNLHRAAILVRDHHGGRVPEDFDALAALPGIGRSTAGAILALSRNLRHPILDGNARRVLARVLSVEGWPGATAVARRLWEAADACTPDEDVAAYTQAIMDLGATVCLHRKPACGRCPLAGICSAHAAGRAEELPAPRPRRERPRRSAVLVMLQRPDGSVYLERRPDEGLWGGLWSLPEVASVDAVPDWCLREHGIAPLRVEQRPPFRHAFTHFDLDIVPVEAHVPQSPPRAAEPGVTPERTLWYNSRKPAAIGLAAPLAKLLGAAPLKD